MSPFLGCLSLLIVSQAILAITNAQTITIIPANEAAAHVGEYATAQGVVAKVFTSNKGNTFLNFGAAFSNQVFTGWIPAASQVRQQSLLTDTKGSMSKSPDGSRCTKESQRFGLTRLSSCRLSDSGFEPWLSLN